MMIKRGVPDGMDGWLFSSYSFVDALSFVFLETFLDENGILLGLEMHDDARWW
jgi:hypothetical protein